MLPERQGQRAAWLLFATIAGLHLLSLAIAALTPYQGAVLAAWVAAIPIVLVGGLIAAGIISAVLPSEARAPFWTTGAICMGLTLLLFGLSCGVSVVLNMAAH